MSNENEPKFAPIIEFLLGSGQFEGWNWGERPGAKPMFWWRTPLREYVKSLESELAKYKDQDKGSTLLSLANEEIGKLVEENARLQSELLLRDITMLPEKDREIDELKAELSRLKEGGWISVKSQQPRALQWVLVWVESRKMSFMVSYRAYPDELTKLMWDDYKKHGLDPSEFELWQPLPSVPNPTEPPKP